MKKVVTIINCIAVAVLIISGLCLDSSDTAMRLCLVSTAYLSLYNLRWEIAKVIYKVIRFYVDAFKEVKTGGRHK